MRNKLLAALAIASLLPPALAGDISVKVRNLSEDANEEWATGSLPHEPVALLVGRGAPHILDACGSLYSFEENIYGERTPGEPLIRPGVLEDIRPLAPGMTRFIGRDANGAIFSFGLDPSRAGRNEAGEQVLHDSGANAEPLKDFRLFDNSLRFGIRGDGKLVSLEMSNARLDGLRMVGGESPGDVTALNTAKFVKRFPLDAEPRLFSATADGALWNATFVPSGDKFTITKRERIGGAGKIYSRTVALLGTSSTAEQQWLVRIDAAGIASMIDLADGKETALDAGVVPMGGFLKGQTLYTLSASGNFAACPEKVVDVAPQPEKKDDKGVFKLIERMVSAYERLLPFFDKVEWAANEQNTPQDQLEATFRPVVDAIHDFRAREETQIKADLAFIENEFGGENGMARFISEITDGRQKDFPWQVSELSNRYEEYRDENVPTLANRFSSNAGIMLMIAEMKGASQTDERLKLFETYSMLGAWAHEFDPSLPGPDELKKRAASLAEEARALEQKALAENKWPGRAPNFTGPGDAGELEAGACDFMRKRYESNEANGKILKCAVGGNWYVLERNIIGEPMSWCLPMNVGTTNPEDASRGWVYRGSMCTITTRNQKPVPEWDRYSWTSGTIIQIDRLK